nr:hypothetical protein [Chlamydiota bacterium]
MRILAIEEFNMTAIVSLDFRSKLKFEFESAWNESDKVDQLGKRAVARSSQAQPSAWKANAFMGATKTLPGIASGVMNLRNTFHGNSNPIALKGISLSSVMSPLMGYIALDKSSKEYQEAVKIHDTAGSAMGAFNIAQASGQILGGLSSAPYTALSIASTLTSAKCVKVAATVFGRVGTGVSGVSSLLSLFPHIIALAQDFQFDSMVYEVMTAPENDTDAKKYHAGLTFMLKRLYGTPEEWAEIAVDTFFDNSLRAGWYYKKPAEISPEDLALLSSDELKFIDLCVAVKGFKGDSKYAMLGHLKHSFINWKKRMRADFIRKTGPKTLKLVSGAAALLPSLENGKEVKAAKRLFTEINKEKWTNRILHVALIGLTILGISALVAGTLSTGGTMSIVIAAALVVVSLGMVAINGYFLYQALQSGSFDTKDKVMFIFSTTLLMSSA